MSGRDDESCDITRHHAIGSGSGSGAGGVRCHSTEGVVEERRGGRSGSGSGSGRQAGAGSIRGSPYSGVVPYTYLLISDLFSISVTLYIFIYCIY